MLPKIKYTEKTKPYGYVDNPVTLGEHIKNKRLESGLLQRQVAKELGITVDTLINWEKNRTQRIAFELIPVITRFLGYCPIEHYRTVGEKIVLYRKHKGLNQRECARLIGCDPGTLARWEKGEQWMASRYRSMLADILGILL